MTKRRQDAWTKDEDVILAETVLRYVREGKTQIEAFTEAGEKLSRTPAACGFRWNATVRKQYEAAFKLAKQNEQYDIVPKEHERYFGSHPIEKAISLLESIKQSDQGNPNKKYIDQINKLTSANEELKEQLTRYQEVFIEIKNLCEWLDNENQIKINNMKNENVQNV